MTKIIVTIIGAILMAFVAWFFFGKTRPKGAGQGSEMEGMDMEGMEHPG